MGADEATGRRRFRILARLGQGGMADVHLAVAVGPHGVNKLVVLKQIREDLQGDRSLLNMFLSEARFAARLNHPNVVQTYEVTEEGSSPTMVMEYLDGQALSDIVARAIANDRCVPLELHLRAIAGALEGLHHAHELCDFDGTPLSLVHRDVSPHNVFVTYEGHVKVLDFGIAKAVGRSAETRPGVLKGKVGYMAPEQMASEKVDRRADIFSVGVMLWEATAGRYMWKGHNDRSIMLRVLDGDVPKIAQAAPWASDRLRAIIDRAMAPSPADRYETAASMLHDVEQEIASLGGATLRELAKYVCDDFQEIRAKTRATLEEQLRSLSLSDAPPADTGSGDPIDLVSDRGKKGDHTLMPTIAERAASKRGWRRKRAATTILLLAGAAAFSIIAYRLSRSGPAAPLRMESDATQAAPPVSLSSAPAPAPASTPVRIDVVVAPASAQILWDERALGNPSSQVLARDGSRHVVRVSAKGFVPRAIEVTLDRDARIELSLERAAPADGPVKPKAPPPSAPSISPPSCDPPYYVDERGIRKMKSECM
jgi:serine/threonine protein kinase